MDTDVAPQEYHSKAEACVMQDLLAVTSMSSSVCYNLGSVSDVHALLHAYPGVHHGAVEHTTAMDAKHNM